MKIALINENSQAAKNGIIEAALKKVVEPMGHEVVNYGMYTAEDAAQLTYVQCGILAAILLNSGAADYVITGCGTGEGAMLALNSFPGVGSSTARSMSVPSAPAPWTPSSTTAPTWCSPSKASPRSSAWRKPCAGCSAARPSSCPAP